MSNMSETVSTTNREYHQLCVNVNGVTKNVFVPVTVSQQTPETVNACRSSYLLASPSTNASIFKLPNNDSPFTSSMVPSSIASVSTVEKSKAKRLPTLSVRTLLSNYKSNITFVRAGNPARPVVRTPTHSDKSVFSVLPKNRVLRIVNTQDSGRPTASNIVSGAGEVSALRQPVRQYVAGSSNNWSTMAGMNVTMKHRPTLVFNALPSSGANFRFASVPRPRLLVRPLQPMKLIPTSSCAADVLPMSRTVFAVQKVLVPPTSIITNPRSLSEEEAVAVGWIKSPISSSEPLTVNNTVSGKYVDIEPVDRLSQVIEILPDDDEVVDIENVEDDNANVIRSLEMSESSKMSEVCLDGSKTECTINQFSASKRSFSTEFIENSRPNSALSVETTVASESERFMMAQDQDTDGRNDDDIVILKKWQNHDNKHRTCEDAVSSLTKPRKPSRRRRYKRHGRRKSKSKISKTSSLITSMAECNQTTNSGYSAVRIIKTNKVQKAKRTGGRPMTVAQRLGIIECIVWAELLNLPEGSHSINHHAISLYTCCFHSQNFAEQRHDKQDFKSFNFVHGRHVSKKMVTPSILFQSRLFSETLGKFDTVNKQLSNNVDIWSKSSVNSNSSNINCTPTTAVSPSYSIAASDPSRVVTVPTTTTPEMPQSVSDGIPLLLHRVDGKPSAFVVARPITDASLSKDKYLLIRTKTGSFLVPMDDGGSGTTASTVAKLIQSHRTACVKGLLKQQDFPNVLSHADPVECRSADDLRHVTSLDNSVIDHSVMAVSEVPPYTSDFLNTNEEKYTAVTVTPSVLADQVAIPTSGLQSLSTPPEITMADTETAVGNNLSTSIKKTILASANSEIAGYLTSTSPIVVTTIGNNEPVNAHRKRIESLKERLRQQEKQLMELRLNKAQSQN